MKRASKPKHLGPEYADQFKDRSVAEAYATRPHYPPEVVSVLEGLIEDSPRLVLDIGCGTGSIAIALAGRVDRVDAVDPSEAMLDIARSRPGGDYSNIRWIAQSAEEFGYNSTYSLIVAAASLHWMDWYSVLPKMASSLSEHGYLAIVGGQELHKSLWQDRLNEIIPRYSTNQDFEPYDLIEELERRALFHVCGRNTTQPYVFSQTISEYVESFHARNGFSRQRMDATAAAEFDEAVRTAVEPFASDGHVRIEIVANIVWGQPPSGTS